MPLITPAVVIEKRQWVSECSGTEERESLAEVLVQSLEDASVNEIDAAWIEEAEQRFQKWQVGKTDGIPSEKFFPEIRHDLGWR